MFEKFNKFFKKKEKEPIIWNKPPKIKTYDRYPLKPKYILKSFLRWLRFKNETGELLIKEETNIDEIISAWNKSLILWIMQIIVTGALIMIALFPFYSPTFGIQTLIYIFSFGMAAYIITKVWKAIIQGLQQVMRSIK